jgi:hypothetical protein
MRNETGSREIFPMPAISSAGSEWNLPVTPDAVLNVCNVLNGSWLMIAPDFFRAW